MLRTCQISALLPHHLLLQLGISPLQLRRSSQWAGLWSMQHSPLETRTWAALSVPAPTVEGSWIGQVSEKASSGKKGPCAAHLTDKRFNQPALHTPHPLLALGTSWSQPPQLPGANIPLHRCDGPSLRGRGHDWAGTYSNYYTFETRASFWGCVGEINFLATPHPLDEGAVIQRADARYSNNLQPALKKI